MPIEMAQEYLAWRRFHLIASISNHTRMYGLRTWSAKYGQEPCVTVPRSDVGNYASSGRPWIGVEPTLSGMLTLTKPTWCVPHS